MHPVLNVAAQQRVHRIALSPIPQAVGKQRKGDSRGAAFAMFAVDRDQRRPGARAIKEAAAVDNAPAEFDRVGDLRHTRPDKIARREKPVARRADGLFGPHSVAWRVHGDVTSMLVGGIAALLLQMLHPSVLAGVWDHSKFQTDLHGRLQRTARFIALTTYGGRAEAETAIARVRRIHEGVQGLLANGTTYSANDPSLLAWVHVTEAMSFLGAWMRYAEPTMSAADQDRYFTEVARIAAALGAHPVPQSRAEAEDVVELMKPYLLRDKRTRQIAHLVLTEPAPSIMLEPLRLITTQAALELLPGWARCMHGMSEPSLDRWLVRASAFGVAQTLRWVFR